MGWRRIDESGWPLLAARLILGATFLWLGAAKVGEPVEFLKLIRQYEMVSDRSHELLNGLAAWMPWLEIWCGALLVLGVAVRGAALTLTALLAAFTAAIASRALGIQADEGQAFCAIAFDCGCGSGVVNICGKLAQNSGLLVLSLIALISRSTRWCLRPPR